MSYKSPKKLKIKRPQGLERPRPIAVSLKPLQIKFCKKNTVRSFIVFFTCLLGLQLTMAEEVKQKASSPRPSSFATETLTQKSQVRDVILYEPLEGFEEGNGVIYAQNQFTEPNLKFGKATTAMVASRQFDIRQEDETLYLALRRWSAESKFQLVWNAGKDFPAHQTRYVADSFEQAVEQVMADTELSSYPLHACAYPNRLMRVLHISHSCER
jgi:hypothetical protein